jgi:hypothetical protein
VPRLPLSGRARDTQSQQIELTNAGLELRETVRQARVRILGTQPLTWNGYENKGRLLKYSYPTPHFSYLAEESGGVHTALTYHRTWETGLIEVTRVSSFSPYFLSGQ